MARGQDGGYLYSRDGKLIPIDSTHHEYVAQHPKLFFSDDEIATLCKNYKVTELRELCYDEDFIEETGPIFEHFSKALTKKGWLKVRNIGITSQTYITCYMFKRDYDTIMSLLTKIPDIINDNLHIEGVVDEDWFTTDKSNAEKDLLERMCEAVEAEERIQENTSNGFLACCYDPEDFYEETNYVDKDGELSCNSSGCEVFATEDEAVDYADDNKPYGWRSFAMPAGCRPSLKEGVESVPKITYKVIEDALYQWYMDQLDFCSAYGMKEMKWEYDQLFDMVKASSEPSFGLVNEIAKKIEDRGYDADVFKKNIYSSIKESKELLFDSILNESLLKEFFFYAPPHNEENEEDSIIGYIAAVRDYQTQKTKYVDDNGNVCDSKSQAKAFDTKGEADNYSYERCPEGWTHFVVALKKSDILNEAIEDFPQSTHQMYRFARRRHNDTGAVRKVSGQPYWVHPEGVALIVMKHGGSDLEIKAAMAHDVLEDTGDTFEDMVEKFGYEVASIVNEITNDKDEIKRVGKEQYISDELCRISDEALTVKLADMLYNQKDSPTESNYIRMRNNVNYMLNNRDDLLPIHKELAQEILDV